MPFPLDAVAVATRTPIVDRQKNVTLDELLPSLLAPRVVVGGAVYDKRKIDIICRSAQPVVTALVNPTILQVIFSDDPLLHHNLNTPKQWQKAITTHDKMTKVIKDLIVFAYQADIPNDVVRKKTIGCINVILSIVNGSEFLENLSATPAKPFIR